MGTLQNMGVFSPQTGAILFETICGDINKENLDRVAHGRQRKRDRAIKAGHAKFRNSTFDNPTWPGRHFEITVYPISIFSGKIAQQKAIRKETEYLLKEFEKKPLAQIKLTIKDNNNAGLNGFHQELTAYLLRSPVFSDTMFTSVSCWTEAFQLAMQIYSLVKLRSQITDAII